MDEIEAIVTAYRGLPEEDKQTHILIQRSADDSEIEAVLSMLAGESSESAQLESGGGALEKSGATKKKVSSLASPRRKWSSQSDAPTDAPKVKQKKRKLRRTSDMLPVLAQAELALGDDVVDADLVDDVEGGGVARPARYVVEEAEEDEDEEEELPLVRREVRSKARSDASSLASSVRMTRIQGLSMSAVDCSLEEAVPEAFLRDLPEIRVMDVCISRSEEPSAVGLLVRPEIGPIISHEAFAVVDRPSDLTPAPEGASAPEGVAVGCSPAASMEVQVGSPLPRDDDTIAAGADPPVEPARGAPITLEVSDVDATVVTPTETIAVEGAIPCNTPGSAIPVTEPSVDEGVPMAVALQLGVLESSALVPATLVASASVTVSERASSALALPLPLFLVNLQVAVL